jgi:hypothetical protein
MTQSALARIETRYDTLSTALQGGALGNRSSGGRVFPVAA